MKNEKSVNILHKIKIKLLCLVNKYYRLYFKNLPKYLEAENVPDDFTPTKKIYPGLKIAVYTAITGGYDLLNEPSFIDKDFKYFAFTDFDFKNSVWTKIKIPDSLNNLNNAMKNRYIKTHPDEFFKDFDYSIYIDGKCEIIGDIRKIIYSMIEAGKKIGIFQHPSRNCIYEEMATCYVDKKAPRKILIEQIKKYKSENFPAKFGLFENAIIIRKSNDQDINKIMSSWWKEIILYGRDQISLPYVLWKLGFDKNFIFSPGRNVWRSKYFKFHEHV